MLTGIPGLLLSGTGSVSSGGYFGLGNSGGSLTGTIAGGQLPLSWYFTVSGATTADPVSWDLDLGIYVGGGWHEITPSGSVSTSGSAVVVSGSQYLTVPSGSVLYYDLNLNASGGGTFSINVPGDATLTLNTALPGSTPEPASLLLTGGGLAALGLLRRRKKKA